jgi:hypothetical protein
MRSRAASDAMIRHQLLATNPPCNYFFGNHHCICTRHVDAGKCSHSLRHYRRESEELMCCRGRLEATYIIQKHRGGCMQALLDYCSMQAL